MTNFFYSLFPDENSFVKKSVNNLYFGSDGNPKPLEVSAFEENRSMIRLHNISSLLNINAYCARIKEIVDNKVIKIDDEEFKFDFEKDGISSVCRKVVAQIDQKVLAEERKVINKAVEGYEPGKKLRLMIDQVSPVKLLFHSSD
jgi:hypothetical protein